MECDRARPLLPALADRALAPPRRWLVARHAAHCPRCAAQLEELLAMQAAIRNNLAYHRAPPGLAARIGAVLPREAPTPAPRPWFRTPVLGFAGSGFVGALAGVALMLLVSSGGAGDAQAIAEAAVSSHIRSLMAEHLVDVATSDRHTVKPWLSARLDLSPPVHDLVSVGFPLVGGRLDYIDGHPAAAVVYRHDKHVINLFAWAAPGAPDVAFHASQQQGFNLIGWRQGGVAYCAVSDVEADQLATFVRDVMSGS